MKTGILQENEMPVKYWLNIKIHRYRIQSDEYLGFEIRKWRIYWPFWVQINYSNTYSSIEKAKKDLDRYINYKQKKVYLSS